MSDLKIKKCPYCGSSLLEEEDGFRCRFCKSYFPFEAEETPQNDKPEKEEPFKLSFLNPGSMAVPVTEEEKKRAEEEKEFQRLRNRNEFIGIVTSFASVMCFLLGNLLTIHILWIPGFVLWAFAAGFAGYQVYRAKKAGHRVLYIRVFAMLLVAVLVFFYAKPK